MKKTWALVVVLAVGLVFAMGPAVTVHAEKSFPNKLLALLPILHQDNQENCKICHTQVKDPETGKKDPKWNSFGEAMKKAHDDLKTKNGASPSFEDMFNTVKEADADGDGVSNIIELVAGSKPGEKDSKPTEEQIKAATAKLADFNKPKAADQTPAPDAPPAP